MKKLYLPKHHIDNLIEAKLIYDSYKTKEQKKYLKQNEEEIFQKYDEIYFDDVGFVESIIMDKLYNGDYRGFP